MNSHLPAVAVRKSTLNAMVVCLSGFSLLCPVVVMAQPALSERPDIASLIQQVESGPEAEKLDAVIRVGNMGPFARQAVPALIALLDDANPALQYEALNALGSIGPLAASAADEIVNLLSAADMSPIQVAALDTLRQIGAVPDASIAKIEVLAAGANDAVRIAAVRCLVASGHENRSVVSDAVPGIVDAFSSQRPSVRNAAVSALVEIGSSVAPSLKAPLGSDQETVRQKACEVAGRLGDSSATLLPTLVKLLDDKNTLVLQAAATAVGQIQLNPGVVVPRLERLLLNESATVKTTALSALAQFGPVASKTISTVVESLKHEAPAVRSAAARTLGQIGSGSEPVVKALVGALQDSHGGVTVQAANALSQLGAIAVPSLVTLLETPEYRDLAVTILGEIGPEAAAAVPALMTLIKSDNELLRQESFIALASIGPEAKAAVPELLNILKDVQAGSPRAGAAYVLGNIGEQSCVPILQSILNEPRNVPQDADTKNTSAVSVRRAAAWALVILQPASSQNASLVLPELTDALTSELALARKEALSAIGKLGAAAESASEALLNLAENDTDPTVRAEALHTLALLPTISDDALTVAVAAMDSDDPGIRNSARFLLGQMGPKASAVAARLQKDIREGTEIDRIVAAWALARVAPSTEHNELAIPFMLQALQYPNPRVRAEAAHTLGLIGKGNTKVVEALQVAVEDHTKDVAEAAQAALNRIR